MGGSEPVGHNPYLRVESVAVYVRDQERSLRFFVDQLGFSVALDVRLQSGRRVVAVSPPDGTTVLRLIAPDPGTVQYELIGRPTNVTLLTDDVLAKVGEWTKRGIRFSRVPRLKRIRYDSVTAPSKQEPVWGAVFARFEDIDGNTFSLVGFDEVSREIEAQRRATAERLEAERRAAQELEIAWQVQARLFPQTLPPLRTLDYAGVCVQARQVGGDYFDFLNLGQQRLGLALGDIAGKGMPAALLMANLQANLRSQCATALDEPRVFLRSVNQLFYENTADSSYATLFFAEYDDQTLRLRYANCGHVPALLFRCDGGVERLESTGTILGMFREWDCSISESQLHPGDALLLYTDGATESADSAGVEFGEQRLAEVFCRHCDRPAPDLVDTILEELKEFSPEQQDDITLIVAKCKCE